jgi:GT2 family glycosyltransferase
MSWDHASVRECNWVPGSYYLVRREVIEQVGLFDPRYFLYYEKSTIVVGSGRPAGA